MKITIEIHDSWLGRPEDLRKILATIAGLEDPPAGTGPADRPHGPHGEPSGTEGPPRGRNGRYSGDDDRSQASRDDDIDEEGEEDPPTDGRQLLGWVRQAGARRQGEGHRLRQEAGIPGPGGRLEAGPGRCGVPVRPVAAVPIPPIGVRGGARPGRAPPPDRSGFAPGPDRLAPGRCDTQSMAPGPTRSKIAGPVRRRVAGNPADVSDGMRTSDIPADTGSRPVPKGSAHDR